MVEKGITLKENIKFDKSNIRGNEIQLSGKVETDVPGDWGKDGGSEYKDELKDVTWLS